LTPPDSGVSWTEQLAHDEQGSGRMAEFTQHYYVGDDPGKTTAQQAISNMLSPEWVQGTAREDCVTIINKAHGAGAPDAVVTIVPPGPGLRRAQVITLAGGQPGDARGTQATLGGATITGDTPWDGQWSALSADARTGISLTVKATTAAIVKIHSGADTRSP
jgi:hypothetical protein